MQESPVAKGEMPEQSSVASMTGISVGSTSGGPVLRKKLFDQNVSDWASRYRKHKQSLDQLTRDCELLRTDVAKHQTEVDERAQKTAELEDKFHGQTMLKFTDIKAAVEAAGQRKQQLGLEVGEARKLKAQLTKECKLLKADYERKHSELARGAEMRDRLEQQLVMYTQQLNQPGASRDKGCEGQAPSNRQRSSGPAWRRRARASTMAASLQAEGKAHFQQGRFRDALQSYAAALRELGSGQGTEEQAAALRANRSLCLLRLGDTELALSEAEQCKELQPDWPKAHFRVAAALRALGRLGEARLAACHARRLAPHDPTLQGLQTELRQTLFPGPAAALGEALDLLEDFRRSPSDIRDAAQVVRDTLLGDQKGGVDVLEAFIRSEGPKTIFRRQNAMGDNWQEEARNGTMSLLSELTKAGPALEQEFLRLSKEADEREMGCQALGCADDHFSNMGTKAADLNRDKAVAAPPAPPAPPEVQEEDAETFFGISKRSRKQRPRGTKPQPKPSSVLLLNLWSDRAVFRVFSFGWPSALACAAAVAPVWAAAVRRFGAAEGKGTEAAGIRRGAWRTWLTLLCPGTVEVARDSEDGEALSEKHLLQHLVCPPRAPDCDWCISLDWCFLVALWKDGRRLWTATFTAPHGAQALPSLEERDGGPSCFERKEIQPQEKAASLAEMARATVSATAVRGTLLLPVPALLRPGPLDPSELLPRGGLLRVVLGVSVTTEKDTTELRASLGFAGPDGRWLDGRTAMLLLTGLAVSSERQRLEKELELVQHNLRQHTELADEAHSEIERTCGGMKASVQHHMATSLRLQEPLDDAAY
ncbi:sti1 [Symbiodinium microadriaticum]|nr:sti1 [Symbiodinium microadriaticum]